MPTARGAWLRVVQLMPRNLEALNNSFRQVTAASASTESILVAAETRVVSWALIV